MDEDPREYEDPELDEIDELRAHLIAVIQCVSVLRARADTRARQRKSRFLRRQNESALLAQRAEKIPA